MTNVARYVKATAKPGEGDRLAELMVEAAESARAAPGCELYIVNRVPGERDTIWVTELWASQEAVDGALELAKQDEDGLMGRIMAITEGFERIDLEPAGGVGLTEPLAPGWERVQLGELHDAAKDFGLAEIQEMRTATGPLGLRRTGMSMARVLPGKRQAFGHDHVNAEETYVVLSGAGTLRIEEDEITLSPGDAVRVAPELTRAFEAGAEGIEVLAVGPRCPGDGAMRNGWWGANGAASGA